jgi:DNA-binding transcriptional LysR family regulator
VNVERLSLDQMRVFSLVAQSGSFSAAARRLRRAQSAVSYAITTLEQQMGLVLFDRAGYRPRLTAAGTALLHDVDEILARTDRLQARAQALASGLESEVALAVDVFFPVPTLARVLRAFEAAFSSVNLRLFVDALGAVAERVIAGDCQLGIVGSFPEILPGLEGFALPGATLVPVAAPSHPLAREAGPIAAERLHDALQLVVTDRSRLTEGRDFAVHSAKTWRLSELSTKHQLLLEGIGWGTMPVHLVAADLEAGRLVRLALERHPPEGEALPLQCVYRPDTPRGPATRWLLDWLRASHRRDPDDSRLP